MRFWILRSRFGESGGKLQSQVVRYLLLLKHEGGQASRCVGRIRILRASGRVWLKLWRWLTTGEDYGLCQMDLASLDVPLRRELLLRESFGRAVMDHVVLMISRLAG